MKNFRMTHLSFWRTTVNEREGESNRKGVWLGLGPHKFLSFHPLSEHAHCDQFSCPYYLSIIQQLTHSLLSFLFLAVHLIFNLTFIIMFHCISLCLSFFFILFLLYFFAVLYTCLSSSCFMFLFLSLCVFPYPLSLAHSHTRTHTHTHFHPLL
jgi:hypothetical protein